jgi:hypothetical protein
MFSSEEPQSGMLEMLPPECRSSQSANRKEDMRLVKEIRVITDDSSEYLELWQLKHDLPIKRVFACCKMPGKYVYVL